MRRVTVYKDFEFHSAHRLFAPELPNQGREIYGECSGMHGHSYKLRVGVAGVTDLKTGMVVSFKELSKIVKELVVSKLDHKLLNSCLMFENMVPTAENMAAVIFRVLKEAFEDLHKGFQLKKIVLWETATSFVEVEE